MPPVLPPQANLPGFVIAQNTLFRTPKDSNSDRIEVEVGDSKQPDFKPQYKVMRWNNEVNFSIRAIEDQSAAVLVNGVTNAVRYMGQGYQVHIGEDTELSEDGGFFFKWRLTQAPQSNQLMATIEFKELVFFKQLELTPAEIAEGASMPDNVIDSYAIYHASKKNNIRRLDGQGQPYMHREYRAGKAFHLYRVKATDNLGNWTWCDQDIDTQAKTYTVTIPQAFLDAAVYPVEVN